MEQVMERPTAMRTPMRRMVTTITRMALTGMVTVTMLSLMNRPPSC
jgi:hypothetical protein